MAAADLSWEVGAGHRDGGERSDLTAGGLSGLLEQMQSTVQDADRLRLIRNTLVSHALKLEQAVAVLSTGGVHASASRIEAAVLLSSGAPPPYARTVVQQLKFPEERAAAYERLGVAAEAEPVAAAPARAAVPAASAPKSEASWMKPKRPADSDDDDSD